jgi:hypothetical protein
MALGYAAGAATVSYTGANQAGTSDSLVIGGFDISP